jgi:hypothetical protein
MRFCGTCGTRLDPGDRYCPDCGEILGSGQAPGSRQDPGSGARSIYISGQPPTEQVASGSPSRGLRRTSRLAMWVAAAAAFAAVEALGTLLVGRLIVPALARSAVDTSLAAVRDGVALSLYAVTAVAAAAAAAWPALQVRRTGGVATAISVVLVAEWTVFAVCIGLALHGGQAVILDSLITHALLAALASAGTVVVSLWWRRTTRSALAAAVVIALVCQSLLPAQPIAASELPVGSRPAAAVLWGIAPDECTVRTFSGSVSGSVGLMLGELPAIIPGTIRGTAALSFDFEAEEHSDSTWTVTSSAGLVAGPELTFDLGLAKASLTTTGGAKIQATYHLRSLDLVSVALHASMASFSWSATSLPGLAPLGPLQALDLSAIARTVMHPDQVRLTLTGDMELSLDGDMSFVPELAETSGKLSFGGGSWIEVSDPQGNVTDLLEQPSLKVGYSLNGSASASARAPWLGAAAQADGDASISLSLEHQGLELKATGLTMEASETAEGSDLISSTLGHQVVAALTSVGGAVDWRFTRGDSLTATAELQHLDKPGVGLALGTTLLWAADRVEGIAALLPRPSEAEVVRALVTLMQNSTLEVDHYAAGSFSASAGFDLLIAKAAVDGSVKVNDLVQAATSQAGSPLEPSTTCVADYPTEVTP